MTRLFMLHAFLMGAISQMESVEETKPSLVFNCRPDNDLYQVFTSNGGGYPRYDTPDEAVKQTPDSSGVLFMADDYPEKRTQINELLLEKAARKNLRLYIEYPASLPNLEVEETRSTLWERGVIASEAFGLSLKNMQILAIHGCHFVPMESENPHIVVARVAGFNEAVYGLPEEAAGAMAFAGVINQDSDSQNIAANLNDFIYSYSVFAQGPRNNPESPSFGLLSWSANPPADGIYYGDDNARSILGTIASAALLKSGRWSEGVLRCLLANLRTSGIYGFRNNSLSEPQLQQNGWRHYYEQSNIIYAPHYESYLWACFLWAYHETGYKLFLDKSKTAIRMTMEAYPDEWRWTNGIAQERARMLLPLAWLVRVEDTPEHRQWLRSMCEEVIARQEVCGAIREELGGPGRGAYGPPKSNEDYGRSEATLLHQNGDPICDLLYTTNFAFLGLHEAAAATGDRMFIEAEDRLAKFLCRIQIRSEQHLELDGAWFRGFDFSKWEYWGSNADAGWGVWSIESGWTQGWIVSVLGMRHMNTSLWDLTANSGIERHFKKLHGLLELD